jgi:hypothetical protein
VPIQVEGCPQPRLREADVAEVPADGCDRDPIEGSKRRGESKMGIFLLRATFIVRSGILEQFEDQCEELRMQFARRPQRVPPCAGIAWFLLHTSKLFE